MFVKAIDGRFYKNPRFVSTDYINPRTGKPFADWTIEIRDEPLLAFRKMTTSNPERRLRDVAKIVGIRIGNIRETWERLYLLNAARTMQQSIIVGFDIIMPIPVPRLHEGWTTELDSRFEFLDFTSHDLQNPDLKGPSAVLEAKS